MNNRERVIAALQHKETDIIPYDITFTKPAFDKMAAFYNDENFAKAIGNHVIGVYYPGGDMPVPGKDGFFRDGFGVVWNRTVDKDIGVIENFQIPEPDLSGYTFPQVPEAWLRKECEEMLAAPGGHFRCGFLGFSLFERAWTLTGMENLLMYMLTAPDFVAGLFNKITEFNLKIVDIFLEYDFDCIYFGDDWGQQYGLIMGPELWRKFIKPCLAQMYGAVKATGRFVAQHSCGDIHEIFPDLVDIGLDVYQTFQPEVYDIQAIKDQYSGRLAFWGGISTQKLLPFESPEVVTSKSIEIMKILGKGGGYIAGPTHAIPGDVPAENIDALIRLLQNQNY